MADAAQHSPRWCAPTRTRGSAQRDLDRHLRRASIPGTRRQRAAVIRGARPDGVTGAMRVRPAEIDFCSAGVLGEDDIAPAYAGQSCDATQKASAALRGDQLVF